MKDSTEYQEQVPVELPIHLPDKKFVDWCFEHYSINRGVFNVIDNWFFEYGIHNIINRRTTMIEYLKYLQANESQTCNKKYFQFGKGGVKNSLYYFVKKCQNIDNSQNNTG